MRPIGFNHLIKIYLICSHSYRSHEFLYWYLTYYFKLSFLERAW